MNLKELQMSNIYSARNPQAMYQKPADLSENWIII